MMLRVGLLLLLLVVVVVGVAVFVETTLTDNGHELSSKGRVGSGDEAFEVAAAVEAEAADNGTLPPGYG